MSSSSKYHQDNRFRDDTFAIVVLMVLGFSIYLDVSWHPFEAIFTWASLVTWLEDAAITAFIVWYFRDNVGRRITTWWHGHHAPHLQTQLDSQTGQIEAEIAVIRDNHFSHLREEMVELRAEVAELKRRLLEE